MIVKLFDSELKVMNLIWQHGEVSAQQLAKLLADASGWSKTTTYTVITKLMGKGAIGRTEPGFLCRARISREQAQEAETNELIDKLFGGSPDLLVSSLLSRKKLSRDEVQRLRRLIEEAEGGPHEHP
jgi:predicted transcriptional regulator